MKVLIFIQCRPARVRHASLVSLQPAASSLARMSPTTSSAVCSGPYTAGRSHAALPKPSITACCCCDAAAAAEAAERQEREIK